MKTNIIKLPVWLITLQLIGYLMGQLTRQNITIWYTGLTKSPLTPPNITFGIVWSILYVFIAITGWCLFSEEKYYSLRTSFVTQLILNWLWTPVFFHWHFLSSGLLILLCLIGLNLYICLKLTKLHSWLRYLNLTYLLWLIFAGYLNLYIVLNN